MTDTAPTTVTESHVAGPAVTWNGRYLRQRCSWCGTVLLDYDLTRVASLDGEPPATWAIDTFVRLDGGMSVSVAAEPAPGHPEALRPPDDSCMWLDPETTR